MFLKQLMICTALCASFSFSSQLNAANNHEKHCDSDHSHSSSAKCSIKKSMNLLYQAFQKVDAGFNNEGGLTVDEIVDLQYFGPLSSTVAYGPFTPDVCGHTNHTNQPGAIQAIGAIQSANLQVFFEGGLLNDPNFPYDTLANAPKLFHNFPIVNAVINDELVNVIATADVRYPGVNGPSVALISSYATYRLRCDRHGHTSIPEIVTISFYITYFDCSPT